MEALLRQPLDRTDDRLRPRTNAGGTLWWITTRPPAALANTTAPATSRCWIRKHSPASLRTRPLEVASGFSGSVCVAVGSDPPHAAANANRAAAIAVQRIIEKTFNGQPL